MKIEFRNCEMKDLDFVLQLKELGMRWYVEKIYGWDIDYQIKRTKQEINKFIDTMRIIIFNNKEIGVTNFFEEDNVYIIGLVLIHPSYQNKGIATKIINDFIKVAKENKKTIKLSTYKYNPARRLYNRLGFKQYKEDNEHIYLDIKF